MEGVKSFFESFKEFVWDIIGYFIPGLFLLIIVSICINPVYFYHSELLLPSDKEISPIVYFLAYILGYVIYGFSEWKEHLLGKKSYTHLEEEAVSTEKTYLSCLQIFKAMPLPKGLTTAIDFGSFREARNFFMSLSPEADQKVYTFMFRSELSRHIGNVSLVLGVTGLIFSFLKWIFPNLPPLFYSGGHFWLLYILLLISYILLRVTRNRFYGVALVIPFSIYLAKQFDDGTEA